MALFSPRDGGLWLERVSGVVPERVMRGRVGASFVIKWKDFDPQKFLDRETPPPPRTRDSSGLEACCTGVPRHDSSTGP